MDLNINNYSSEELVKILYLPIKNNYTIHELTNAIFEKIEIIINEKNDDLDKNTIFNFYKDAFVRLANISNINISQRIKEAIEEKRQLINPKIKQNIPIELNKNFIIKYDIPKVVDTFPSKIKAGIVNPLKRKNVFKILNINTRFRKDYDKTISTNFIFSLPYTVKKVLSLKLVDFEFCNSVYNFSKKLNNNTFTIYIKNKPTQIINIIDGAYTAQQLEIYLNYILLNDIQVKYDIINGKFYFYGNPHFSIDFTPIQTHCGKTYHGEISENQLTAGWTMGYKKIKYIWEPKISDLGKKISNDMVDETILPSSPNKPLKYVFVPEAPFDCKGTRYFLVSINDYNRNHGSTIISPFKEDMLADNNIVAKIPYKGIPFSFNIKNSCCRYIKREYFGPVNLNRFEIKIYDEYGRIVDINNIDYSLSFELEILYNL